MSQILHIFRKDVRHHWPEILLSLALLIAYAVEQPRTWTGQPIENRFLSFLLGFLPALMVLSWGFLIVRVVQGETLVGDRQFWVTRPYEWPKLLLAKLLFIFLFFHLALFIMQLSLLKVARFPVMSSIPGLLYIHSLLAATLVLATLALACISSGIGQASLSLLVVFLSIIGIAFLSDLFPDSDITNNVGAIDALLIMTVCIAVVLVQYKYRKALLSRLIVGAAIVLILLVMVLAPYEKLIRHEFPSATSSHPVPVKFTFDHSLSFAHGEKPKFNPFGDEVDLEFPFQITGLSDETIFQIRAMKLDLDLPTGEPWTSHWRGFYDSVSAGRTREWTHISMKKAFFNRIKDASVKAHISLALNVFRTGPATEIVVAGDRVSIPGGAWCLNDSSENVLKCFSALKQPSPMFIVADLPNSSCALSRTSTVQKFAAAPASFAVLSKDSDPDSTFSPIQQFTIALSRHYSFEDLQIPLPICVGTRLVVSQPRFLYAVRDEIDLGNIALMNYLPTYPRLIIPPQQPLQPGTPTDSLSQNFVPATPPSGPALTCTFARDGARVSGRLAGVARRAFARRRKRVRIRGRMWDGSWNGS